MANKSGLTRKKRLLALKALREVYKNILRNWLKLHNKKGVKYTVRAHREWIDENGWNHLGEREYSEPISVLFDGQVLDFENTLPFLSVKKMNDLFIKEGFPPVNFEKLSQRHSATDRLIDFFNDSYEKRFEIYAKLKK